MPSHAIVRVPSPRIAEGEVTHLERERLDVALAMAQHAAYVELLAHHGLTIVYAPEAPEHPDGLFVEDAVFIVDGHAVITRPGAPSRRGEVDSMVPVIRSLGLPMHRIAGPATLDGGDVLVTPRHVFVGRSTRTDDAAIAQVAAIVAPLGRQAVAVPVERCLHLKSAVTTLPDGSLIAVTDWIDVGVFESLGYTVRESAEPAGGDLLCLGSTVVAPANAIGTIVRLRQWGFDVEPVEVDELQKIESGVTCMSVLVWGLSAPPSARRSGGSEG